VRRLAAAAACLALAGCGGMPFLGGNGMAAGPRLVTVALVDAFSGGAPNAAPGPALQNSLQLEIDALNAQGGVLGAQVRLVTADDQLNPTVTATVVHQVLRDRSVRLLVGPGLAGLYLGAKPLIELARVPNCVTSMAADDLMQRAPYTFRAGAAAQADVPSLLSYLQHGTQLKKVGLIVQEDGSGLEYDRQLSEQASRYGLQYLGAAFVPPTGDQRAQVQQLARQGADAVVVSGDPVIATRTLQAIALLKTGPRPRAFGFGGLSGYGFVQQAGDAANGVVFVSTIQTYLSDVPEARWPAAYHDFVKRAQARFGAAPNGVEMKAVPAAADCVLQWARAVVAANDLDGTHVAKAWETLDVPATQSLLGVRERFAADNHDAVPADGLSVYQWVKNGSAWGLKQLVGPST
jgi:branched-chain amino acid transport system substrate-binding protein